MRRPKQRTRTTKGQGYKVAKLIREGTPASQAVSIVQSQDEAGKAQGLAYKDRQWVRRPKQLGM